MSNFKSARYSSSCSRLLEYHVAAACFSFCLNNCQGREAIMRFETPIKLRFWNLLFVQLQTWEHDFRWEHACGSTSLAFGAPIMDLFYLSGLVSLLLVLHELFKIKIKFTSCYIPWLEFSITLNRPSKSFRSKFGRLN